MILIPIVISIIVNAITSDVMVASLLLNSSRINVTSNLHLISTGLPVVQEKVSATNDIKMEEEGPDVINATTIRKPTSKYRYSPLDSTTVASPWSLRRMLPLTPPMRTSTLNAHTSMTKGINDFIKVRNGKCRTCNGTQRIPGSARRTLGIPAVKTSLHPRPDSISNHNSHPSISNPVSPSNNTSTIPPLARWLEVPPSMHIPISPFTNVTPERSQAENIARLCAFPPYSDRETCISNNYFTEPLSKCEKTWALVLLVCFVKGCGLAIIAVNGLIVIIAFHDQKMRTQYDAIKASLAIADMIFGILVLTALLPNIFNLRHLSEEKAVKMITENVNTPGSIIAGSLLTISKQASLLHLMFMSIERYAAIKWSIWHIGRRTTTVAATLIVIWTVSIMSAFIPAAFPNYFEYQFQPAILLHTISLRYLPHLDWRGPVLATFTLFLPYIITVTFCVMTGIASYRKLRSAAQFFGKELKPSSFESIKVSSECNDFKIYTKTKRKVGRKFVQPEITVFVTLLLMVSAFTLTLLPFTITLILFVVEVLDCTNYTVPYVTTFYIGLLNSLANGLIYSVRDEKFRKSALKLIQSPRAICR